MKLYATVTSERASKGKALGGQEYIFIELMNEDGNTAFTVKWDVKWGLIVVDKSNGKVVLETKGEKQKGEECKHESTLSTHDGIECADCHVALQ